MSATATRAPDALAFPGLSADYLTYSWDEGVEGEIRDASRCTRGQAIAAYASEVGCDFTEVRCVARYVLLHTRQDVWEGPGSDRYADDLAHQHLVDHGVQLSLKDAWKRTPERVPDGWEPSDGMACWSVCRPDHPRAIKTWMCEVKGDGSIPDPPDAREADSHG